VVAVAATSLDRQHRLKDATLDATSLPKVQMPNRAGFVKWEPQLLKP
jgi:hypothetical protein